MPSSFRSSTSGKTVAASSAVGRVMTVSEHGEDEHLHAGVREFERQADGLGAVAGVNVTPQVPLRVGCGSASKAGKPV